MARNKITIGTTTEELNDARLPASLGTAGQVLAVNSDATSIEWATIQSGANNYESVKVSSIANMGALRQMIDNINQQGKHCFFDFSDYISGAYVCTVQMYSIDTTNYCYIFDLLNHKIYGSLIGYLDETTIPAYATASANNNDIPYILRITDTTATLADIIADINRVNAMGHHVFIDVSAFNTKEYLVTFTYKAGLAATQVQLLGLVGGIIASNIYDNAQLSTTTLSTLLSTGCGQVSFDYDLSLWQYQDVYKTQYGGYLVGNLYFSISCDGVASGYGKSSQTCFTNSLPTNNGSKYTWTSLASSGKMLVACTTADAIAYSYDGVSWKLLKIMTPGTTHTYNKVVYNPIYRRFTVYAGNYYYNFTGELQVNYGFSYTDGCTSIACNPNTGYVYGIKANDAHLYSVTGGTNYNIPEALNWSGLWSCNKYLMLTALSSNKLYFTEDGTNWMCAILPSSANWKSICAIPGGYVAVCDDNSNLYYSNDLINWTTITGPNVSMNINEIVYNHNRIFVNGYNNSSTTYSIMYTLNNRLYHDGIDINQYLADTFDDYIQPELPIGGRKDQFLMKTAYASKWSDLPPSYVQIDRYPISEQEITLGTDEIKLTAYNHSMATDGNMIVIGGYTTPSHWVLFKSIDAGATWIPTYDPGCEPQRLVYANNIWLAALENGTNAYYSTDDCNTWTATTLPLTESYSYILSAGNLFFQRRTYNRQTTMYSSSDCITWTLCTSDETSRLMNGSNPIYWNGYYWIKSNTNNDYGTDGGIYKSYDGITWTRINTGLSVDAGKYTALIVGNKLLFVSHHYILYTEDGSTWYLTSGTPARSMYQGFYDNNGTLNWISSADSYRKDSAFYIDTIENFDDLSLYHEYASSTQMTSNSFQIQDTFAIKIGDYAVFCASCYDDSISTDRTRVFRIKLNNTISQNHMDVTNLIKPSDMESTSNKVTSISSSSINTQYPSAAAVYSYTDAKGYVTINGTQYQLVITDTDPGTGTAGQIIIVTG